MADFSHKTDGPSPLSDEGYDESLLPDFHRDFLSDEHLQAFASALSAPDPSPSTDDLLSPVPSGSFHESILGNGLGNGVTGARSPSMGRSSMDSARSKVDGARSRESLFITAQNDWAPVNPVRHSSSKSKKAKAGSKSRRKKQRSSDETREGYLYTLLKWPLLGIVIAWVSGLGISYLWTRLYIWLYEHFVAWRGKRERLRRKLHGTTNYADWVKEAKELDAFLGNEKWKEDDEYAYYDHKTVRRVLEQMKRCRRRIEGSSNGSASSGVEEKAVEDLKALVEACVKNNFVGVENSRLYSQTYYGTKNLVQDFIDEGMYGSSVPVPQISSGYNTDSFIVEKGVTILVNTNQLDAEEKRTLFKRMHTNFGRTALCLSGGASFAYYHFGVVKALLDANLLPEVITGTSGGALVAALVATRTNEELKKLLVPALAGRINACSEGFTTWIPRWWKTGARFDSLEWAKKSSWFTRGSMTFKEAYERTGRILNVSCVPADPHSPTLVTLYNLLLPH